MERKIGQLAYHIQNALISYATTNSKSSTVIVVHEITPPACLLGEAEKESDDNKL